MPKVTYIEHNGTEHTVDAAVGKSLMQVAVDNMVPGILADCGGTCSCATCHAYIPPEWIDKLPEKGSDEAFMLEGALDVAPSSRLTCQLTMTEDLDGLVLRLPVSQT